VSPTPNAGAARPDGVPLGETGLLGMGDVDDPLAQPTRARLFARLRELRRPAGTIELAEAVGLHRNGVRMHLERLEEAGLLRRTRERQQGRGRPRDLWTIAPDARPGGALPAGYLALSRWLARAVPAQPARLREIERTGRDIGRELAPGDAARGEPAMEATLSALGFQPATRTGPPGHVTYCLGNCPFRAAVRENQPVVCTLHRGMTRGLLDVLLPDARLANFVPRDPDEAGCLIELDRLPGDT
jgi:predicted ArsR family transcriptional regulator